MSFDRENDAQTHAFTLGVLCAAQFMQGMVIDEGGEPQEAYDELIMRVMLGSNPVSEVVDFLEDALGLIQKVLARSGEDGGFLERAVSVMNGHMSGALTDHEAQTNLPRTRIWSPVRGRIGGTSLPFPSALPGRSVCLPRFTTARWTRSGARVGLRERPSNTRSRASRRQHRRRGTLGGDAGGSSAAGRRRRVADHLARVLRRVIRVPWSVFLGGRGRELALDGLGRGSTPDRFVHQIGRLARPG